MSHINHSRILFVEKIDNILPSCPRIVYHVLMSISYGKSKIILFEIDEIFEGYYGSRINDVICKFLSDFGIIYVIECRESKSEFNSPILFINSRFI